jgi:hypothetical protein
MENINISSVQNAEFSDIKVCGKYSYQYDLILNLLSLYVRYEI